MKNDEVTQDDSGIVGQLHSLRELIDNLRRLALTSSSGPDLARVVEDVGAALNGLEATAESQAARIEVEHVSRLRSELLTREETTRRQWQSTFDAMTDGVVIADRSDRLIRANRAFYNIVGLPPEDCAGKKLKNLLHKPGRVLDSAYKCPVCELRRKGERGVMELPPGVVSTYPILVSVDPVCDERGKTIAIVQVMRDLSDLYREREAAERERLSLNATIEQMAEGFIVFDETAAIVRANKQALSMLGFTLEQLSSDRKNTLAIGRFSDDNGREVSIDELPVPTAMREQRAVDEALWYKRPDGQKALLYTTASPFFNNNGRVVGAILLVRDVTERKRERERVQQAEKLRALGQLASGVAHNFNNALAAVIGYTQLAMPKVKDPDVEKYLRVVEQSAKDAARMVERIQNFSRARSRKDELMVVRIGDVVRDAIDITRPRWRYDAQALGIRYDVTLAWQAEEDTLVTGEPSELREVFVNIILNALDAMAGGGQLAITASPSGPNIVLSFADTGEGMTEEIKHRIFEPFFTTKGVSGLGMGLSESYRIIERHGGRIEVESRLRRGTTFTITLPLARIEESVSKSGSDGEQVSGARVMVIDDEEFVRNVLSIMLVEQGHKVVKAASAEEGLKLLERHQFDVVFTDLAMPKSDGVVAAREIKRRSPGTKVVLMSGYGSEKAIERAGENDCIDAAISKPFRLTEIRQTMQRLVTGH